MFSLSLSRSSSSLDDEISVIFVLPASGELLGLLVLDGNFVWPVIELSRKKTGWGERKVSFALKFNDEKKERSSTLTTAVQKRSFHAIDGGQNSLVNPLSELGMSVFRVDDAGSLQGKRRRV
jgi:hypothetical protein